MDKDWGDEEKPINIENSIMVYKTKLPARSRIPTLDEFFLLIELSIIKMLEEIKSKKREGTFLCSKMGDEELVTTDYKVRGCVVPPGIAGKFSRRFTIISFSARKKWVVTLSEVPITDKEINEILNNK